MVNNIINHSHLYVSANSSIFMMKENKLVKFQNDKIFILNKAHIQLKIGETITSWVCYRPGLLFTVVETHTTIKNPQGYIMQHSLNRGLDICKIHIPILDALFS